METEKACVLRLAAGVVAQGASQGRAELPDGWGLCLGTACAWYDARVEKCAVLALARGAQK